MKSIWFAVERKDELPVALNTVSRENAQVTILVIGDETASKAASRFGYPVKWVNTDGELGENFATAAVELLKAEQPDVVCGVANPAIRAILAAYALATNGSIASNVVQASLQGEDCLVTRSVYNDFTEKDRISGTACLLINPLLVREAQVDGEENPALVEAVSAASDSKMKTVEIKAIPSSKIETADRVVGIGMGVKNHDVLDAAKALAAALGGEVGGSMNVVESTDYLPGERYIGLSGIRIAPKLYIALGISGASQHLVGVRNANTVVVINKDPKAKFFNHAEYGIVGDVEEVIPALIEALN